MEKETAIKILKELHDKSLFAERTALETIIPELKESWDERIRKELIFYLGDMPEDTELRNGVTNRDVLVWLEKQKSVREIVERCKNSWYNEGKIDGMAEGLTNDEKYQQGLHDALEKQGDCSAKWEKNTPDNKPTLNHLVLMKTNQCIAEGEWNGKYWIPYRWLVYIKDSDVLAWMELSDLDEQCEKKHINNTDEEIVNAVKDTSVLDLVESKFKVGDWIVDNNSGGIYQVTEIRDDEYCLWPLNGEIMGYFRIIDVDNDYHLWTIQDAKDGDVLVVPPSEQIFIFKEIKDRKYVKNAVEYYCRCINNEFVTNEHGFMGQSDDYFSPATKEQRDLLFQKMKEAGYEWDAEKKELKLLITNGGDFEPKQEWSEKDEKIRKALIRFHKSTIDIDGIKGDDIIAWLEKQGKQKPTSDIRYEVNDGGSLSVVNGKPFDYEHATITQKDFAPEDKCAGCNNIKGCMACIDGDNWAHYYYEDEQKQEWSEEDMSKVQRICKYLDEAKKYYADITEVRECVNWLKSLKDRVWHNSWKPSEEQLDELVNVITEFTTGEQFKQLNSLYEQLIKL